MICEMACRSTIISTQPHLNLPYILLCYLFRDSKKTEVRTLAFTVSHQKVSQVKPYSNSSTSTTSSTLSYQTTVWGTTCKTTHLLTYLYMTLHTYTYIVQFQYTYILLHDVTLCVCMSTTVQSSSSTWHCFVCMLFSLAIYTTKRYILFAWVCI